MVLFVEESKVQMLKRKGENGKINTVHNSSSTPDDEWGVGGGYITPHILKFGEKNPLVPNVLGNGVGPKVAQMWRQKESCC